jgi:putative ABC transport system permease protein
VVVSKTMADRYWPARDPIGRRVSFEGPQGPWWTVVGVAGDMRRLGLSEAPPSQVYVPFAQDPWFFATFVMRTTGDPVSVAPAARRSVWAVDPNQAIAWIQPMDELLSSSIAKPRLSMMLLTIFAGIALLLTAIGIYGVMAHSVNERIQEIGVRIALGVLTLAGLVIGLAAAFALGRVMSSFLFNVSATDVVTFTAVSALLVAIAVVASYMPARRAAGVTPTTAFKYM